MLRGQDPAAFTCLTTTPVTFAYADAAAVLRATGPMIGLDPRGRIRQIRFNGRSLAPVRLPAARARAFYAAYRTFAELAAGPDAMVTARLAPRRLRHLRQHPDPARPDRLHRRRGHRQRQHGRRHLQGCYADLDGLASAVAVLARDQAGRAAQAGQAGQAGS